jgi:hypothetical protein
LPDGWLLVSGSLAFGDQDRPRLGTTAEDLVAYSRTVRRPDNVEETSTIDLRYTISGGTITIDLCPPLALCVARTELIGPFDPDELVLTHFLANTARSVHRFIAARPD